MHRQQHCPPMGPNFSSNPQVGQKLIGSTKGGDNQMEKNMLTILPKGGENYANSLVNLACMGQNFNR